MTSKRVAKFPELGVELLRQPVARHQGSLAALRDFRRSWLVLVRHGSAASPKGPPSQNDDRTEANRRRLSRKTLSQHQPL